MPYRSKELALAEREAALERELHTLRGPGGACLPGDAAIARLEHEIGATRTARASACPARRRLELVVRRGRPCSHEWRGLSGSDVVRKCTGCKQDVYDFSGLSSEQAGVLIGRGRKGRLPRRLFRRTDGSIVVRDCPRFGRRRAAMFALAVVLGALAVSIDV